MSIDQMSYTRSFASSGLLDDSFYSDFDEYDTYRFGGFQSNGTSMLATRNNALLAISWKVRDARARGFHLGGFLGGLADGSWSGRFKTARLQPGDGRTWADTEYNVST